MLGAADLNHEPYVGQTEAERIATARDVLRAEQRARRAACSYVALETNSYDSGGTGYPEPEDECEYNNENECELSAAAPENICEGLEQSQALELAAEEELAPDAAFTVASQVM